MVAIVLQVSVRVDHVDPLWIVFFSGLLPGNLLGNLGCPQELGKGSLKVQVGVETGKRHAARQSQSIVLLLQDAAPVHASLLVENFDSGVTLRLVHADPARKERCRNDEGPSLPVDIQVNEHAAVDKGREAETVKRFVGVRVT